MRPAKPAISVRRAKRFRRELTKPEFQLWQILRTSPGGHKFRKQHPAGPYILDFFCARANLAIEIDGFAHDTGERPERDARRDAWLHEYRIDTLRIPASAVLNDVIDVVNAILVTAEERMLRFGKAPPSSLRDATSPSQVDGERDNDDTVYDLPNDLHWGGGSRNG
jgi:very-short-patch-repair endonuclease